MDDAWRIFLVLKARVPSNKRRAIHQICRSFGHVLPQMTGQVRMIIQLDEWCPPRMITTDHPRKLYRISPKCEVVPRIPEWWSLAGACCGTPCWRPGLVIDLNRPQGARCKKQSEVLPTWYHTATCDSCDQNVSLSRFCAFVWVLFASIWWIWTFWIKVFPEFQKNLQLLLPFFGLMFSVCQPKAYANAGERDMAKDFYDSMVSR